MQGKTNFTQMLLALALVAAIIFGASTLSVAGGDKATGSGGSCSETGAVYTKTINMLDVDQTQINTTADLFLLGDKQSAASGDTGTSGYANLTTLACGTDFKVIMGDGSSYYYKEVSTAQDSAIMYVNKGGVPMTAIGTIGVSYDNSTSLGGATASVTMGSGETSSEVMMHVKEATANAQFGLGKYAVCFNYDVGNFSSVKVAGAKTIPIITTQASGYESCWEVSSTLSPFKEDKLNVIITAKAGVDPQVNATTATTIGVKTMDFANYKYQGAIVSAYENIETGAAIGATDDTGATDISVY